MCNKCCERRKFREAKNSNAVTRSFIATTSINHSLLLTQSFIISQSKMMQQQQQQQQQQGYSGQMEGTAHTKWDKN